MKIFATITPAFESACNEWLEASLQASEPGAELVVKCFPLRGSADFQSLAFKIHNHQKNRQLVEWIREHLGQVIFVTDADIIYLRPFLQTVVDDLADHDLALAQETVDGDDYNIGQMAIRCTEKTARFFETVGSETEHGAWDQEAVNRLLTQSQIRHTPLSLRFANNAVWQSLDPDERRQIVSYHATGTEPRDGKSSMELKRERIEAVTEEWGRIHRGN